MIYEYCFFTTVLFFRCFHYLVLIKVFDGFFFFCLQHDAACRVIARLKKERDEARQLLAEGERQLPAAPEVASENVTLSNGKRGMLAH